MRIEALSIKAVTVSIFLMIGIVAIILSLLAGSYFRKAALDAQMNSLSRVIEVASEEMLKQVKEHTFDLGMRLGHGRELIHLIKQIDRPEQKEKLITLIDDPFINGFVGFSNISLVKIRIYNSQLELIAESSKGIQGLENKLNDYLIEQLNNRHGIDRLKAIDALWMSPRGPLFSTLVPVGGLHMIGYLEIIINPALNLPEISKITKTPVSVFSVHGEAIQLTDEEISAYLPVRYTMMTSDNQPAYRVVGYENVDKLNQEMQATQIVTTTGFLLLTLMVLFFALWLFHHFLFKPVGQMIADMKQVADGELDLNVNKKGLQEFYILASAFNSMADQVRARTNELRNSQSRLLHLLDLDESAIVCFGQTNDVVYFNRGASDLFGYFNDEMNDLEFSDLFTDDIDQLMQDAEQPDSLHIQLQCIGKDGQLFHGEAVINSLDAMGESAYAVVLHVANSLNTATTKQPVNDEALLDAGSMKDVEQSLKRILEIATNNPGLLLGEDNLGESAELNSKAAANKALLREQAVNVMHAALACWEHDLDKTKLELAEESKIWPVYIDKSTPTTRTLDKYLHVESCPKNPRCQRVVDTAEFVLKQLGDRHSAYQKKLIESLDLLRHTMSGV